MSSSRLPSAPTRIAPTASPASPSPGHSHADSSSPPSAPRSGQGGSSRRSTRVLNCDHCREKKMKCDRGQPCSNCLLREVECVYENPQPDRGDAQPVRTKSFMIATLRRDAAQLIAKLGLSQKEVEKLALEADRQLADEAAATGGTSTAVQPSQTVPRVEVFEASPRMKSQPYPVASRPWTAPQFNHAPVLGPVRTNQQLAPRRRSDALPAPYAVPYAASAATAAPPATTAGFAPAPYAPQPSSMAPPPVRSSGAPSRARKPRPARITLPLPNSSRDKEHKPALTPGWLSCKPIRSSSRPMRSPGPITPRRTKFGLPSIDHLAGPGWPSLTMESS